VIRAVSWRTTRLRAGSEITATVFAPVAIALPGEAVTAIPVNDAVAVALPLTVVGRVAGVDQHDLERVVDEVN
jgi:hypothetical protein